MMLVEGPDGDFEIVKADRALDRTIGFKVTSEEYAAMLPFVESFHECTMSAAMRWLIEQPEVRDVMRHRIDQMTQIARKHAMNGAG
jgi:hypothetical protein